MHFYSCRCQDTLWDPTLKQEALLGWRLHKEENPQQESWFNLELGSSVCQFHRFAWRMSTSFWSLVSKQFQGCNVGALITNFQFGLRWWDTTTIEENIPMFWTRSPSPFGCSTCDRLRLLYVTGQMDLSGCFWVSTALINQLHKCHGILGWVRRGQIELKHCHWIWLYTTCQRLLIAPGSITRKSYVWAVILALSWPLSLGKNGLLCWLILDSFLLQWLHWVAAFAWLLGCNPCQRTLECGDVESVVAGLTIGKYIKANYKVGASHTSSHTASHPIKAALEGCRKGHLNSHQGHFREKYVLKLLIRGPV